MSFSITIHESIREIIPTCRLGYIVFENAVVRGASPALTREFFALQQDVAKAYQLDILPKVPRILAVRSMYKKLAFDPSRYRPASEALVRRVLQSKGVYYVNSAVDVSNYCSIKYLLPFGLYDMGKIQGDVSYRLADGGQYVNVAGNTISTDNKPFLSDGQGVFGNPTSDSLRTTVTLASTHLLTVVYADEEVSDAELDEVLSFTADMMVRYNGGTAVLKNIVHA